MTDQSESIAGLCAALVAAQSELKNPVKDSVNPHFKSKFANLASVREAVVPVLAKHGLAVSQMPCIFEGQPALCTMLLHKSGEWLKAIALLMAVKSDPQGIGSAQTYARRYALQSIAGVTAEDDDDGHQGSQPAKQQAAAPKQQPAPAQSGAVDTGELKKVMVQKGWDWAMVLKDINANDHKTYPQNSKPGDIDQQLLGRFLEWLRDQPSATGGIPA